MVSITAACLGKASYGAMILLEKNPKPGKKLRGVFSLLKFGVYFSKSLIGWVT